MAKKKTVVKCGKKARKAAGGNRYTLKQEARHKKAKKQKRHA